MNLSVVILPAKVLANGTHKIRIAMSHNGDTRYYVTRFAVPSPKNLKNGKVVGKEIGNANYINMQIAQQVQEVYRAFDTIKNSECYTCAQLLSLIKEQLRRSTLNTFGAIAAEWLDVKRKQSKANSVHLYELGVQAFTEFAGADYLLSLLTLQQVCSFDDWLEHRAKLANPTINMRMRVLRSVVHYAITRRYIELDANPFEGYKERPETSREAALPLAVLQRLITLQTANEHVMLCRDCLLLSFYMCGMNLADLFALDLSADSVKFVRTKTKTRRADAEKTEFTIPAEARTLIDQHLQPDGRHLQFGGRTTPSEMNNYFFRHLPKLAEALEYDGRLIYYSMRKTFAQMANELGIQERVIAYCIGDTYSERRGGSIGYYIKTTKKLADEAIAKVIEYTKTGSSD